MVAALVVLAIAFQLMSGGRMLTPSNAQNLITGNAYVLMLAIGMVMVIVIGQIDLSVGSVAGFVGMFVSILATNHGLNWLLAVLLGLVLGVAIGAWHGFWLSKVGIPGFITTLAGMMIFRGLVIWISGSISVAAPKQLEFFGAGYLPEWGPAATGMNNSTLLLGILAAAWFIWTQVKERAQQLRHGDESPLWVMLVRSALDPGRGRLRHLAVRQRSSGNLVPVPGLILVVLVIIYHVITQRTPFGRHVYAVGGNRAAAALSGVNTQRTYFLVMLNMSFLAALAGILFSDDPPPPVPRTVRTGSSTPSRPCSSVARRSPAASVPSSARRRWSGDGSAQLGPDADGRGRPPVDADQGLGAAGSRRFDVYNKQQGRPSILGYLTRRRPGAPVTAAEGVPAGLGPVVTSADATASTQPNEVVGSLTTPVG